METKRARADGWSTTSERAFIDNLGKHSSVGRAMSPAHLLSNYLRAMALRKRWLTMEALELRDHAQRRLSSVK